MYKSRRFSSIQVCLYSRRLVTVNVLKFRGLVIHPKSLDKQPRPRSDCFRRSSLIRVFPVCYSDNHFVNSSPDNHHYICKQKKKSVRNLRTFIVTLSLIQYNLDIPFAWRVGRQNSGCPKQQSSDLVILEQESRVSQHSSGNESEKYITEKGTKFR